MCAAHAILVKVYKNTLGLNGSVLCKTAKETQLVQCTCCFHPHSQFFVFILIFLSPSLSHASNRMQVEEDSVPLYQSANLVLPRAIKLWIAWTLQDIPGQRFPRGRTACRRRGRRAWRCHAGTRTGLNITSSGVATVNASTVPTVEDQERATSGGRSEVKYLTIWKHQEQGTADNSNHQRETLHHVIHIISMSRKKAVGNSMIRESNRHENHHRHHIWKTCEMGILNIHRALIDLPASCPHAHTIYIHTNSPTPMEVQAWQLTLTFLRYILIEYSLPDSSKHSRWLLRL
jgi:hypothetical protein